MDDDDGELMIPEPPPRGLRRFRAGAWCGIDTHPREIITAAHGEALAKAERNWRCVVCSGVDFFTRR